MGGWELSAPIVLEQGTRLVTLDPTVYNVMTVPGPWKSPPGTWGRLLCVSASPCFYVVAPSFGDHFLCGIFVASELSAGPFVAGEPCLSLLRFGSLEYPSGSWCARWGGGLGTGGLFYFSTDSSCRRSRGARRQGRGGGVRRDD